MERKIFTDAEALLIPSSSLAYLGDSVIEVLVRRSLIGKNEKRPSVKSLEYVTAEAQSAAADIILPLLTEHETDVYKRAKNNVKSKAPKHATNADYSKATGLEALFGYLYLTGKDERSDELFSLAFPSII